MSTLLVVGGYIIDLQKIGGAIGTPGTPSSGISELKFKLKFVDFNLSSLLTFKSEIKVLK